MIHLTGLTWGCQSKSCSILGLKVRLTELTGNQRPMLDGLQQLGLEHVAVFGRIEWCPPHLSSKKEAIKKNDLESLSNYTETCDGGILGFLD